MSYFTLFRFDKTLNLILDRPDTSFGVPARFRGTYDQDNEGTLATLTPAFGMAVSKALSLGVAINIWQHDVTGNSTFEKTEFFASEFNFGGGVILPRNPLLDKSVYEVTEGYSFVL